MFCPGVAQVSLGDFRRGWEQMGTKAEVLEKFALGFKRLEEAVAAVEDFLGMQTCDGTGRSAVNHYSAVHYRLLTLSKPRTASLVGAVG